MGGERLCSVDGRGEARRKEGKAERRRKAGVRAEEEGGRKGEWWRARANGGLEPSMHGGRSSTTTNILPSLSIIDLPHHCPP